MKGIMVCAECANYDLSAHRCRYGCKEEPKRGIDDSGFFTDCPLPTVKFEHHADWLPFCGEKYEPDENGSIPCKCSRCGAFEEMLNPAEVKFCWRCGAKMDGGAEDAAD